MKRTKKQITERKAKAAEIAALYATVANGGRMQEKITRAEPPWTSMWISSRGPDLNSDLSYYRAIPAPAKKPATKSKLTGPGGTQWLENDGPRIKGQRTKYREVTIPIKKKP